MNWDFMFNAPDYFEMDVIPVRKPQECNWCNEKAVEEIALEYKWGWGPYYAACELHSHQYQNGKIEA